MNVYNFTCRYNKLQHLTVVATLMSVVTLMSPANHTGSTYMSSQYSCRFVTLISLANQAGGTYMSLQHSCRCNKLQHVQVVAALKLQHDPRRANNAQHRERSERPSSGRLSSWRWTEQSSGDHRAVGSPHRELQRVDVVGAVVPAAV